MENATEIFCKDRWSNEKVEWKVGVWNNYGIDSSGQSNYCAQSISFLAWAKKKPTFKEIWDAFPELSTMMVMKKEGYKKVKNSDLIITKIDGLYWKDF
jgi:hypothetical protein